MRLWPDKKPRRTQLFVPADKPNMIRSALASDADCLIFDLEDAVAPENKDAARTTLLETLNANDFGNKEVIVRVNAYGTSYHHTDLEKVAHHPKVNAIMLPKVESREDIDSTHKLASEKPLWLIFETAKGVFNIRDILRDVARLNIKALCFGNNDFSADIGTMASQPMIHARSEVVLAARANNLMVFDGPSRSILQHGTPEENPVSKQAKQAFDLGFDGTMVIHPSQIAFANRAFTPTAAEIAYAEETVGCRARGAAKVNGELTESLHLRQARETLAIVDALSTQVLSRAVR